MEQERWSPIPGIGKTPMGFTNEISSFGNVASLKGNQRRILRPFRHVVTGDLMTHFYPLIPKPLTKWGRPRRKCFKVRSLVAAAFLPPRPRGSQLGFRDGDRTNCRADNLYWLSIDEVRRLISQRRKNSPLLTPTEKAEILGYSNGGMSGMQIARLLGRAHSTITEFLKRERNTPGAPDARENSRVGESVTGLDTGTRTP